MKSQPMPSVPAVPARAQHTDDLHLAQQVLLGSAPAWAALLERYSGLIQAVIRRSLYSKDVDERRNVYVATLEALYRHKLATYEGRAALSTWLVLVTRTEVLDHLRRRYGRREESRRLSRLSPGDRELFELYYVEGLGLPEARRRLSARGVTPTVAALLEALRRIDDQLDSRMARRLAYDLRAQSVGAASGRMLEYLDHVRSEFDSVESAGNPEYQMMEREARETAERVLGLIRECDPAEREILTLRFERGWPAWRISEELGLPGARSVYTILERIVRRIRRFARGLDERA